MIVLMDEDLSGLNLASRLNAHSVEQGCTFRTLPEDAENLDDTKLPDICRRENAVALLTHDKTDFGAEISVQQAVVDAGVSVVMLRLPNPKTEKANLDFFEARISGHLPKIVKALKDAQESLLITVRKDKVTTRNLREILRERLL